MTRAVRPGAGQRDLRRRQGFVLRLQREEVGQELPLVLQYAGGLDGHAELGQPVLRFSHRLGLRGAIGHPGDAQSRRGRGRLCCRRLREAFGAEEATGPGGDAGEPLDPGPHGANPNEVRPQVSLIAGTAPGGKGEARKRRFRRGRSRSRRAASKWSSWPSPGRTRGSGGPTIRPCTNCRPRSRSTAAAIDVRRTTFGFREWEWSGRQFKLNGVPWQLWADCTLSDGGKDPEGAIAQWRAAGQNTWRFWGRAVRRPRQAEGPGPDGRPRDHRPPQRHLRRRGGQLSAPVGQRPRAVRQLDRAVEGLGQGGTQPPLDPHLVDRERDHFHQLPQPRAFTRPSSRRSPGPPAR